MLIVGAMNVTAKSLFVLFCVQRTQISILSPEAGCPGWHFGEDCFLCDVTLCDLVHRYQHFGGAAAFILRPDVLYSFLSI